MKKIEKYLYENRHVAKDGQVSLRYYGKFTTWDHRPLTAALGDDLNAARVKLDRLHKLNDARVTVELDEEKELREALELQQKQKELARKGITFREWAEKYFDEVVPKENGVDCETMDGIKRQSTVHGQELRVKTLNEFFGDVALCDIGPDLINKYRKARSANVSPSTVNRSLSLLGYLLNLAADPDHGVLDAVPRIKKEDENDRAVQRSVDEDEYRKILSAMREDYQREQQRVIIGWWETSMRHQELFDLKWSMVDLKAGLLRLPATILKERFPRRTPISYELRVVLEELRTEQSKVANLSGHVFTRKDGRPIRDISRAFDLALERAGLQDSGITPHSFRRAAITRWTDLGIPRDIVMVISGHKPSGVHDGYIHLTDKMLVDHFREKGLLSERRLTAVA
jgi:integrase